MTQDLIDITDNAKHHEAIMLQVVQRLDDLRDAEVRRVNEQMALRSEYSKQLGEAESKRIDAIRSVDVAAVAVANEKATAQAVVLASQVSQSAENLRSLVAATASTVAQQLQQISAQFNDRLAALEKSSYEGVGKSTGGKDLWGYLFGIGAFIVGTGIALYVALK